MNWQHPGKRKYHRNYFAPESVVTEDGRRVMWAWLATLETRLDTMSIMSLPREIGLRDDGLSLTIKPLRELKTLRGRHVASYHDMIVKTPNAEGSHAGHAVKFIDSL